MVNSSLAKSPTLALCGIIALVCTCRPSIAAGSAESPTPEHAPYGARLAPPPATGSHRVPGPLCAGGSPYSDRRVLCASCDHADASTERCATCPGRGPFPRHQPASKKSVRSPSASERLVSDERPRERGGRVGTCTPFGVKGQTWAGIGRPIRWCLVQYAYADTVEGVTISPLPTAGFPSRARARLLLAVAASYWQGVTDVRFEEVLDPSQAEIRIGAHPIAGTSIFFSVMAHANFPGAEVTDGDIHFNSNWYLDDMQFVTTAEHEFGHAIGLQHIAGDSRARPTIMDAVANRVVIPTERDAAQAQWLYGAPVPSRLTAESVSPSGGVTLSWGYPGDIGTLNFDYTLFYRRMPVYAATVTQRATDVVVALDLFRDTWPLRGMRVEVMAEGVPSVPAEFFMHSFTEDDQGGAPLTGLKRGRYQVRVRPQFRSWAAPATSNTTVVVIDTDVPPEAARVRTYELSKGANVLSFPGLLLPFPFMASTLCEQTGAVFIAAPFEGRFVAYTPGLGLADTFLYPGSSVMVFSRRSQSFNVGVQTE